MSILKKKETIVSYELKPEQIKSLIANDLGVDESKIDVNFIIREVGGDYFDRFPGTPTLTEIKVTVKGD